MRDDPTIKELLLARVTCWQDYQSTRTADHVRLHTELLSDIKKEKLRNQILDHCEKAVDIVESLCGNLEQVPSIEAVQIKYPSVDIPEPMKSVVNRALTTKRAAETTNAAISDEQARITEQIAAKSLSRTAFRKRLKTALDSRGNAETTADWLWQSCLDDMGRYLQRCSGLQQTPVLRKSESEYIDRLARRLSEKASEISKRLDHHDSRIYDLSLFLEYFLELPPIDLSPRKRHKDANRQTLVRELVHTLESERAVRKLTASLVGDVLGIIEIDIDDREIRREVAYVRSVMESRRQAKWPF